VGVRVPPSAPVEIHRRSENLGAFLIVRPAGRTHLEVEVLYGP